jgi:drug/metabolite transporter (DMT)-like permease
MSLRGLVLFIVLSVLRGVPYLLIKVAVAEVSVPFLVLARSALGAAVLLPFAMRGFASVRAHWRPVLAFAFIEMIVPQGLIVHGETRISSSTAGLLIATTPIITVALGRFRRGHERLGAGRVAGLLLGLAGVAALAVPELGGDLFSVLEVLLAAACYAVGSMIAARWLGDVPAIRLCAHPLRLVAGHLRGATTARDCVGRDGAKPWFVKAATSPTPRRGARRLPTPSGHDALRPARGMGGLAGGLAAVAHTRLGVRAR